MGGGGYDIRGYLLEVLFSDLGVYINKGPLFSQTPMLRELTNKQIHSPLPVLLPTGSTLLPLGKIVALFFLADVWID